MGNLGQDIRHALRRLCATPTFTLFGIATLALGIGAATAIYSAVYEVVLRPQNIRDIDRVVNIYHRKPPATIPIIGLSYQDFQDLRSQQTGFSHLAAWSRFRQAIIGNGSTEYITGEMVSGDFFGVIGATPALGRFIGPADDQPGVPPVVVVSYAFWQRWFGGDPAAIGQKLRTPGHVFEVVGVAPPDFKGVAMPNLWPTPMWIPLTAGLRMDPGIAQRARERDSRFLLVKGRLKPGSSREDAVSEVSVIARRLDVAAPLGRDLPERLRFGYHISRSWFAMPASQVRLSESADALAMPLAAAIVIAVVLVLLVACTNLANLTLARASRRRHEVAVRRALGASRSRLIREQVVEGSIVALAGGLSGLLIAWALMRILSGPVRVGPGVIVQLTPGFNVSVVAAAVGAAVLTLIVFSLFPALRMTRTTVDAALKSDGAAVSFRWGGRKRLISAQVIVSTILITLALLCVQQIQASLVQDLGVDLDRIAGVQLDFAMSRYEEPRARLALDQAVRDLRMKTGVEQAAIASGIPLSYQLRNLYLATDQKPYKDSSPSIVASVITGTPALFGVFGIDIVRGRAFDARDNRSGLPVGVITEAVARRMFDTTDVVGRQMQVRRQPSTEVSDPPIVSMAIIGVARDPNTNALGRREDGYVFRPWEQDYDSSVILVARTAGDPSVLLTPLRRTITDTAPEVAILEAGTGVTLSSAENLTPKIVGSIAGLLGAFALVLSIVGLYGVLSHMVAGRTREMGVRMALGADSGRIKRMIVREGLSPVIGGLTAGLLIGIGLRMTLRPLLASVFPALDPLALLIVPIPFLAAAFVACYLPARRASRVDPMAALRHI